MEDSESVRSVAKGVKREWLVRYSELFLKSDWVFRDWVKRLVAIIRQRLPEARARVERGRIWLEGEVDSKVLRQIFGIASFSEVEHVALEELERHVADFCRRHGFGLARSFAIRVKRVGAHEFTSADIAVKYGDLLRREFPQLKVDLRAPDKTLYIEIRGKDAYLYDSIERGAGGIPPGVEGTLVALISGGIDSAVACYLMMKRGCRIVPLHIRMTPFASEKDLAGVEALVEVLRNYQPGMSLKVIEDDFLAKARETLEARRLEKYTCILCKRRMYRLACRYAEEMGARGVVTGESLGQVASQTLDNLYVLEAAASMPIFRPLIGFDKEEIVAIARAIGTFQISARAASRCAAAPARASTSARLERIHEIESLLEEGARAERIADPSDERR